MYISIIFHEAQEVITLFHLVNLFIAIVNYNPNGDYSGANHTLN